MHIWIDVTNSPHAVIFRPFIARLRDAGHEVTVTSREYAQTIGLLDRFGIEHTVIGAHGGGSRRAKAQAMAQRSRQLTLFARSHSFDLAVAHGSTDQPVAARASGTPQVTMFDYEHAAAMHHLNGRLATRVLVPAYIPEWALTKYGIRPPKLVRYPGLKEEYYLADHTYEPGVLGELGLDANEIVAVLRPPPEVTLYHRGASTEVFAATLDRLLGAPGVQTVVLPRSDAQREMLATTEAIVPEDPVDGPSLIQASDVVVSAGGTMNREAVALGVPAYTPFAGTMGAVDSALIDEGRLRRLEKPEDVVLEKRNSSVAPPLRDPAVLIDLVLAVARRRD